jgi:hypothetical protein
MKRFFLAVTILGLCSLSFARTPNSTNRNNQREAAALAKKRAALEMPSSAPATDTCSYSFTSGANNTFLQYCVTENGNILQVVTPSGQAQITNSTEGEGYSVCDVTGGNIAYSDYGLVGTTTNWNSPTLVSHTATSVKISRITSDGIWTLTQTITQVASTSSIKVVMALKNNTASTRAVNFLRYADVDADGVILDNLDGTHNTAMAWTSTSGTNGFGLMLQNVGTAPFDYDGFVQNVPDGPNPCTYTANFTGKVVTSTDGSLVIVYTGEVPAKSSKTFNMMYKGL